MWNRHAALPSSHFCMSLVHATLLPPIHEYCHPQRADQHVALKASMRDPSQMISRANRCPREPGFVGRKPSMHTHIHSTRAPGRSCYLRRRGLGGVSWCYSTSLQPTTMPYVYLHVPCVCSPDVLPRMFVCRKQTVQTASAAIASIHLMPLNSL